jgi:hypothetical protein
MTHHQLQLLLWEEANADWHLAFKHWSLGYLDAESERSMFVLSSSVRTVVRLPKFRQETAMELPDFLNATALLVHI